MKGNERLAWSVKIAAHKVGISTHLYYQLYSEGRLPGIRISERRIIVPVKSLEDYLASKGKMKD